MCRLVRAKTSLCAMEYSKGELWRCCYRKTNDQSSLTIRPHLRHFTSLLSLK